MFHPKTFREKSFRLTNTMEGKKVEFQPASAPKVSFYSCGPTVYGPLHIGNARSMYTPDLMARWLRYIGYEVDYVRNYTDVDDKIINRAKEEKISPEAVAQKYIEYCEKDLADMKLGEPNRKVTVTESMADIVDIIQTLVNRGVAYVVKGEVLFSIDRFAGYGKLSRKNLEDLQAGARVEVGIHKKNPMDFSLWKPHKSGEPHWSSPWSEGRPGWHIECSAMARRWLGETIDLHHGGQDLIFPHHENEIAQSEAASGKEFSKYWVHTAFLTIAREKMSKSLGNVFEIRQFLERFGAEILKYLFVKHHYRSPFDFDEKALEDILSELERVYLAKKWAMNACAGSIDGGASGFAASETAFRELSSRVEAVYRLVEDDLFNDLNTPGALGNLFTLIRDLNRAEVAASGKAGLDAAPSAARTKVAQEFLCLLDKLFGSVMNVFGEEPSAVFSRIEAIRRSMQGGAADFSDADILKAIEDRKNARLQKDFAKADEIRKSLDSKGVVLIDGPSGTSWKWK